MAPVIYGEGLGLDFGPYMGQWYVTLERLWKFQFWASFWDWRFQNAFIRSDSEGRVCGCLEPKKKEMVMSLISLVIILISFYPTWCGKRKERLKNNCRRKLFSQKM